MRFRFLSALLLAASSSAAAAQVLGEPAPRGEFGVRYWLSTGETLRSHNAQPADPTLGNPTSVLLYENLDASIVEVFGRQRFERDWFLKGTLGIGMISRGSFDDEDFNAGQVKFSDTTSSMREGFIGYGSLDLGRQWALGDGGATVALFVGYSRWTENMHAYGATDHLGFIGGDIDPSVRIISNRVIWNALRVGAAGEVALGARTRLSADLAFVPYARVRNEDSHHLRADLGPVPNIVLTGTGWGMQLDAELRREIAQRTELGLGVRYWHMEAESGSRELPNFPGSGGLPLVELYSKRFGVTLSLRKTW